MMESNGKRIQLIAALSVILLSFGTALGTPLSTGDDPDAIPIFSGGRTTRDDCQILYYSHGSTGDYDRIVGLGYDITQTFDITDLEFENLINYNVVIFYIVGPGELADYQDDLEMYVSVGGSLFIHQPGVEGLLDYTPPGFDVEIADRYWCNFPDDYAPCIVDSSHPITTGMSNDDLSGDFDLVGYIGPSFTLLAQNCVCEDPALAAGMYNDGKVVFDTGNFSTGAIDPATDDYIIQLLDYLCDTGGTIDAEARTWGGLKSLYQ